MTPELMRIPDGSQDELDGSSDGEQSCDQDASTENHTDIEREEKNFLS